MHKRILFLLTQLFLAPAFAFAAEEHQAGGAVDWWLLKWPVANFVLYLIVLRYLYNKYVPALLKARSVRTADQLTKTANELSAAEQHIELLQKRLEQIDDEKRDLFDHYEMEGKKLVSSIVEDARLKSERLQRDTKQQIDRELELAKKELRLEAVARAVHFARRDIKANLSKEEDRRLRRAVLQPELFQSR